MKNQVDQRHLRKNARASKACFDTVGMLLAWFSVSALFHLAGIAWPGHSNFYIWVIFLFSALGIQRIYSGLLWFVVLLAKPQWVGVGDTQS